MNTIIWTEMTFIYAHTTIILSTASLIMGITLLILCGTLNNNEVGSKLGLKFLSAAMFILTIINFCEFIAGVDSQKEYHSLSIIIFAASTELFLLFMAYMSMLNKEFATRKRIYFEIGCIVLFTAPALFISPDNHPLLFNVLFAIGITFYCIKFLCNYIEYKRQMKMTIERVKNLLSDDSSKWLKWINSTFNIILIIGITSVIIPMTNFTMLTYYNSFIIVAYLYVYLSVIQKISIFNKSMKILESDEVDNSISERIENSPSQVYVNSKAPADSMNSRQKLLDEWIANRGYAEVGITATSVAAHLKTNRTKLSYYLKNTLNTTYYDWIAMLRIEDAKRQLIDYPDRNIYEIAINIGIEDRDNFRHLFQKIVGVSPSAYRKQNSN